MLTSTIVRLTIVAAPLLMMTAGICVADKAPLSEKELEKQASHIISGEVVSVTSKIQSSRIEQAAGIHRDRVFTIKLKISSVKKGKGLQVKQQAVIKAWQAALRFPPVLGLQGHSPIPKPGDTVIAYLNSVNKGEWEPLLPNGLEIQKPGQAEEGRQLHEMKQLVKTGFNAAERAGLEMHFVNSNQKTGDLTSTGITPAERNQVLELARRHGLKKVENVYAYRQGRPDGPALIGVEADVRVDGRDVFRKILKVNFKKWSPEGEQPRPGDLQIGEFWAGPPRNDRQKLLRVGANEFHSCFIQLFRNEVALSETLHKWIRDGQIPISADCRDKFEGATRLEESTIFKDFDLQRPDWFLMHDGTGVSVQFPSKLNPDSERYILTIKTDFREAIVTDLIQPNASPASRLVLRQFVEVGRQPD